MNALQPPNLGQTMSSLEIAALTGKRHDNVMRDIKEVLGQAGIDALKFEAVFLDSYKRGQPCYNLPALPEAIDLIKSGLTDRHRVLHDLPTGDTLPVWCENLFSIGVNTPRTFAVFLCLPYCAALCRHFTMAGCFGQLNRWLATNAQYSHPTATRRPCREKHVRRITSLSIGVTA